ncbi:hypothetical protein F4804DRAFT_239615 [Jackrogersella minutella]|nr:hypothetical protein F4804DRAFT_239615 [Jackrogersella minutella]
MMEANLSAEDEFIPSSHIICNTRYCPKLADCLATLRMDNVCDVPFSPKTDESNNLEHPDTTHIFSRFKYLPNELSDEIWEYAARQREDAFRRCVPQYRRLWRIRERPPYLTFMAPSLSNEVVKLIRELFWPLLRVCRASHEIAKRYVSILHQRRTAPKLVLNFIDGFLISHNTLYEMVFHSAKSNDDWRARMGVLRRLRFPGQLEVNYNQQFNEILRATFISAPASTFEKFSWNLAYQGYLGNFRSLKTLYFDLDSNYMTFVSHTKIYTGFQAICYFEVTQIVDGQIRWKYEDEKSFWDALKEKYHNLLQETCRYGKTKLEKTLERTLAYQESWKENRRIYDFSDFAKPFIKRGVNCALVCNCREQGEVTSGQNTVLD